MAIVVASLNHLDITLGDGGFLGEFLTQEIVHQIQVAVEEPTNQSQSEHVTALEDGLIVHPAVSQTVFHHRRQGALHHTVGVDTHLTQVVGCGELSLLQVVGTEGVGIDDDGGLRFGKTVLCLQRGGVHRHQHITLVTGGIDLTRADMHLKTAYSRKRPLRGADVGGIVGKRRYAVAHRCRHGRENVSGQLHTIAGIAREADYYLFQFFHFQCFSHN